MRAGRRSAQETEHIHGNILNVLSVYPEITISELAELLGLTRSQCTYYYRKVVPSSIGELSLDIRSYNCLRLAGITDVKQLITKTRNELKKIPNLGEKSLQFIVWALGDLKLKLKD